MVCPIGAKFREFGNAFVRSCFAFFAVRDGSCNFFKEIAVSLTAHGLALFIPAPLKFRLNQGNSFGGGQG